MKRTLAIIALAVFCVTAGISQKAVAGDAASGALQGAVIGALIGVIVFLASPPRDRQSSTRAIASADHKAPSTLDQYTISKTEIEKESLGVAQLSVALEF